MVGVWYEGGLGEDRRCVVDDEEEGVGGQRGQVLERDCTEWREEIGLTA